MKEEFYFCNFDLDECDVKKNNIVEFKELLGDILSQKYTEKKENNSPGVEYLFVYNDIEYEKEKNLIYLNLDGNLRILEFFILLLKKSYYPLL